VPEENPVPESPGVIDDHLGPVEYLAIEFPNGHVTTAGFEHVLSLVDAGMILVLDLEFARRVEDRWSKVTASELAVAGVDLGDFAGADSSLLDDADRDVLSAGLAPDSVLAILVYENLAMHAALKAWGEHGAKLVAEGPISLEDLEGALPDDLVRIEA
jgi:hypothetical protein